MEATEDHTIFEDKSWSKYQLPVVTHTPIMRACERGRTDIVFFLYNYFKNRMKGARAPKEFDIYADDERTGENCAQITARTGNHALLQWLVETVQLPLKDKLNRRNENALQLACIGSKKYRETNFMQTIKYLVDNVGIDVTYEYEETLLAV